MNEIVLNIISCVVTVVVIPLISLLGGKLIQLISSKIKDEKASSYLTQATNIVLDAVRSVFQTYVEALKKEGKFDADAQLVALNKAKEIALNQLSDDLKEFITKNFGNLTSWLANQIEASINLLKYGGGK